MRCRAIIIAGALSMLLGVDSAEAKIEIMVEKASQRMIVMQDGYMRYIWPVSTGRDALETPNGTYTPQRMERNWFSSEYYNSPMPYAIFFHNGYAIHGSYAINQLGGPASHGCVRLHPHHAALLFDLVQHEGPGNTTIEVTDDPPRPDVQPPPPRESEQARETSGGGFGDGGAPKPGHLGEFGDMAELRGGQREIRPVNVRPPPPLRYPPAGRRQLTSLIEPVKPPRGPCGTRTDSADCRTRPKAAEAAPRERPEAPRERPEAPRERPEAPQSALAAQPVPAAQPVVSPQPVASAQPAPSVSGMKVLPASCWSGAASRWQWWRSGQSVPCK